MYKALSPGAIGVKTANLQEAIAAAQTGGFEGVEFSVHEVAGLVEAQGADYVKGLFADAKLKPAGWGLPTDWRSSEENWRKGLDELPRLAKAAAAIGCPRTMTWILPGSNDRPYEENRRFHIERFTPIAQILADNGCHLGLEFIGPKTLRDSQKYPFVYKMNDMLEMGREIGPNVGLLLDCWHWYTSEGNLEELKALRPEQVVYVHVNDAPAGVDINEQVDNVRALPGETGVIDIAGFLQALQTIGYDGPVTPEPFKKELNDLPSDAARLEKVGAAMNGIFRKAGLG
ncbi:MAG: sugar phosphate isomerase/epimerase [Abitibacteriaceae bacterium]|nr:sugar phosphate isomerase/epimerase [Abditibacteriaceae bacterium]